MRDVRTTAALLHAKCTCSRPAFTACAKRVQDAESGSIVKQWSYVWEKSRFWQKGISAHPRNTHQEWALLTTSPSTFPSTSNPLFPSYHSSSSNRNTGYSEEYLWPSVTLREPAIWWRSVRKRMQKAVRGQTAVYRTDELRSGVRLKAEGFRGGVPSLHLSTLCSQRAG